MSIEELNKNLSRQAADYMQQRDAWKKCTDEMVEAIKKIINEPTPYGPKPRYFRIAKRALEFFERMQK